MKTILLILALTLTGCASAPPTVTTPQGQIAFKADQVVVRINELQSAAIQAEAAGGLPTATTRIIVQFAVSADTTLKTLPQGWQVTVTTAWMETKKQLTAVTNPSVLLAIGSVDALIAALTGA